MLDTALHLSSLVICASSVILLWQIIVAKDRTTRVLCADVFSVQCLALAFLLAFYGLGSVALQFGFAISLLGFISTLILAHLVE